MSKLITLNEAINIIEHESIIALGGNVLHRSPIAAVTEIIKQEKKDLHIVKTAGALDVDLLCAANCVKDVTFGFVSYEPPYGLCNYFRKSVESGKVVAHENACYTVIMALRAATCGLSFIPTRGLDGSDLAEVNGLQKVKDPYNGNEYIAIKAINPDYAILHVQEADDRGNCTILGPIYEDIIMAKASKKVIVTTEKIVSTDKFMKNPNHTSIAENLVDAVVLVPWGAGPGSCAGNYGVSDNLMKEFKNISRTEEVSEYLNRVRHLQKASGEFLGGHYE